MKDYFMASKYSDDGFRNGIRKENEDTCYLSFHKDNNIKFFAIMADGVGGLNAGKRASSQLVDSLARWFSQEEEKLNTYNFDEMKRQFEDITSTIHEFIKKESQSERINMGTTLTALLLTNTEYFIVHVGDSRAYLYDGSIIRQLTKDQTLLQRELDAGAEVSEEEKKDKGSTLLQCIGTNTFIPSFYEGKLPAEFQILLCSDGMINTINKDEIAEVFSLDESGKKKLIRLTDLARSRGEADDITSVFIGRIKKEAE